MTDRDFTGLLNMRIELVALALICCGAPVRADAPVAPPEMEAAHQVLYGAGERDWHLDTAVFFDLSPVTATEPAVQLPDDQRDEPVELGDEVSPR